MRRILICTGVLGGGTALTFVAAALAATLLPGGTVVPAFNAVEVNFGKGGVAIPMPQPPVVIGDGKTQVDIPPTPQPTN